MITKEARETLDELITKSAQVVDQWQGTGLQDRTHIQPRTLHGLKAALETWFALEIIEA